MNGPLAFTYQPHNQQQYFLDFLQMFYQDHSIRSIFSGIEQLLDKVVDDTLLGRDAHKENIFKLSVLRPAIGNIFKEEKINEDNKQIFAKLLCALKVKKEDHQNVVTKIMIQLRNKKAVQWLCLDFTQLIDGV